MSEEYEMADFPIGDESRRAAAIEILSKMSQEIKENIERHRFIRVMISDPLHNKDTCAACKSMEEYRKNLYSSKAEITL